MGINPSTTPQTFSWAINTENLKPGTVVAYKSYAQNIDGNWGQTELKTFKIERNGETTTLTNTISKTTTISGTKSTQTCSLEGDPCRSDEHCCHGYCCEGVCSSSECKEPLGVLKYLIAMPVIIVLVLIVVLMRSSSNRKEDEYERLKEKWNRRFFNGKTEKDIMWYDE